MWAGEVISNLRGNFTHHCRVERVYVWQNCLTSNEAVANIIESDVAELFRQRFRRETRQGRYVLHYAASGAEALDRLSGEIEPALVAVLSDINMPGMDGLQLLGEIKQRFPDLPVMMVTAYGDDERRRQAAEYGAADFLAKPVDFEHLKAQLRQLPGVPD
jgi:CheY-like chemotaxis protein